MSGFLPYSSPKRVDTKPDSTPDISIKDSLSCTGGNLFNSTALLTASNCLTFSLSCLASGCSLIIWGITPLKLLSFSSGKRSNCSSIFLSLGLSNSTPIKFAALLTKPVPSSTMLPKKVLSSSTSFLFLFTCLLKFKIS